MANRRKYAFHIPLLLAVSIAVAQGQVPQVSPEPTLAKAQISADGMKLPEFEVATIKPTPPANRIVNALLTYPGGRIVAQGCTLHYLMIEAFHLDASRISGGPSWTEEDRFDIEAKPPSTSASSKLNPSIAKLPPSDEQRQMLQALLIDRFQLKFHRSTKQGLVYVMTKREKGLKLTVSKDKNEYPWAGGIGGGLPSGDGLRGTNISMPQLAERLSHWLGQPVLDQTHLQGSFDFEYQSGEDDASSNQDLISSVITSLKGIGLNLKASQGEVESLVIDSIQKPSAN